MKCDCMKIIGCMQVGGNCSWILNTSLSNMSEIVDEIVLAQRKRPFVMTLSRASTDEFMSSPPR